jgi:hypothetical protein
MTGRPVLLTAYPNRIRASSDGKFVAFSFLSYFYLLNNQGQLLGKHHVSELLKAIPSDKLTKDNSDLLNESSHDIEIEGVPFTVTTSVEYGPTSEGPYIDIIDFAPNASFCLIVVKNNIFWLTMEGIIAHTQSLTLGFTYGSRYKGSISFCKIFEGGSLILAHVRDLGFSLVVDGQEKNIYKTENCISSANVAYNNALGIFAVAEDDEIKLFNMNLQIMTSMKMNCCIDEIAFSSSGDYLIVLGYTCEVLKLIKSEEPVKYIPVNDIGTPIDMTGFVAEGPEGEVLWNIKIGEYCFYNDHCLSSDGREIVIATNEESHNYFNTYVMGELINAEQKRKRRGIITLPQNENRKQVLTFNGRNLTARNGTNINFAFEANARIHSAQLSPSCNFIVLAAGKYVSVLDNRGAILRKIRFFASNVAINDLGQLLAFAGEEITGIEDSVTFTKSFLYGIHYSIAQQGNLVAFLTRESSSDFVWVIDFDGNILMKLSVNKSQNIQTLEWASDAPVLLALGGCFMAIKVLNV